MRGKTVTSDEQSNRYFPIEGGWRIRIDPRSPLAKEHSDIGVCTDDPRLHRRPLYPPADRGILLEKIPAEKVARLPMRPLVLAFNAPRFLFDFHHAGGLIGHLIVGFVSGAGDSAWLHNWTDIEVQYVNGRMEYQLADARFPGTRVSLVVAPLADAAGAVFRWNVEGTADSAALIFCFGGVTRAHAWHDFDRKTFVYPPDQKVPDETGCSRNGFVLRRTFDPPQPSGTNISIPLYPPGWVAEVCGGCSPSADGGLGDPHTVMISPAALLASASWVDGEENGRRTNCVAVQRVRLQADAVNGHLVIGMGATMKEAMADPPGAYAAARSRAESIARRVRIQTPDPYLNAAAVTMAFCLEGIWGDLAYLHGGWTWRIAYLGWRIWYGPDCYGWADRVKTALRNHLRLTLIRDGPDRGGMMSTIEYPEPPIVYYNMQEVFLDHVRHYFDYTDDRELMREIYPVLKGLVEWENRRLKPAAEPLYENALNTWISDSHWRIGALCTQASAYMLNAHHLLARLAGYLGEDPEPWQNEAARIREAMQRQLWQPQPGVFAEALDTLGRQQLHPEPELPTIYHSAEFGAADPSQIQQMLRWVDTHLPVAHTAHGGKQYWSSNWHPNRGRSYTHSTYELAYAEELNYALTNYLGGRADEAWALICSTLCGIFNGPTPGGLSCHANADGTQRRNDEFADAISLWPRAVLEGLFGIVPKRPEGLVELCPQFPADWDEAAVETPHFSYRWRREDGHETLAWTSPVPTRVHLRLPVRATRITGATSTCQTVAGVGLTWVAMELPEAVRGTVEVRYEPATPTSRYAAAPRLVDGRRWVSPGFKDRRRDRWTLIDLSSVYNAPVTEVIARVVAAARPPSLPASGINFEYRGNHLSDWMIAGGRPGMKLPVSDAAWRAKVGDDGVAWTAEGIPFKTAKAGDNIAVVTLAGGFPECIEVPVGHRGRTLFLMLSGLTWPMQSHVVNLRLTFRYRDGATETRDLVNPTDIGDCWDTWLGWFHDTAANGFENIGGRFGPAGSNEVADLTQPVEVDTEAHLIAVPLLSGRVLESMAVQAYANDVVFGLMGATILRRNDEDD